MQGLEFDENGMLVIPVQSVIPTANELAAANSRLPPEWATAAGLEFDENGMLLPSDPIIAASQAEDTSPGELPTAPKAAPTGFQFDENGMLMASPPPSAAAAAPAPEAASVSVAADTEEGAGFLTETWRALAGGARDALQETGETIQWAGEGIGEAIMGDNDLYITDDWNVEWLSDDEVNARTDIPDWQKTNLLGEGGHVDLPEVAKNESMVGGFARGITQFATGYATLGRQLKIGGGIVGGITGGAVTDFVAFDEHEDRFSDLLRDELGLRDPITEFLAAEDDDSVLEGKLKNAIEGAGLGVAAEGLFKLATAFKRAKQVQAAEGDEAAAKVMNEAVADIPEEQLSLFDSTTDPNLAKADVATPQVRPAAGAEVSPENADVIPPPAPEAPAAPVNVDHLTESLNREIALQRGGSIPDPDRVVDGKLFNFDKMDSEVDIKDVLNMASDAVSKSLLPQSTSLDQVTNEARRFLADSIDVDPDVIDKSLALMAKNADAQRSMVVAGKVLVQSLSREVERLAFLIDGGRATEADADKFVRMQSRLVETAGNLKATITGAAQATSAGRIRTSDWLTGNNLSQADILKQMRTNIADAGGRPAVDDLARAIVRNKASGGGTHGLFKIAEGTSSPMRIFNEVWINGILSGPKTHMINVLSNTANTLLLPAEKMLGGAWARDGGMIREGARQYAGLAMALKDSTRMMAMAFRQGRNILDPEASILEANGNSRHAIRSTSSDIQTRDTINGLGELIRLPSRGLLTMDEFFKQLNYRSSAYAELVGQAHDLVGTGRLKRADVGKWVVDRLEKSVSSKGVADSQRHLDYAREATFTQDLRDGTLARNVQNLSNKHPALKLILPFVRTPTNILKASLQRTPGLHRLSETMKADLASGDARRVAAARGKLTTGSIMWGSAIIAANEGLITGRGPSDPLQRQLMLESGWRPYSFVIPTGDGGKRYVEYRRLDPFAMFFGIAADIADIGGQIRQKDADDLGAAALVAFASNVTSKTYLQGLSEFFGAMSDPERNMPRYVNSMASSMIPYSAALREMRKVEDPAMRDVRGILDAMMNTVPGFSEALPARRSWITGQPITYPKGWGAEMMSPVGEAFASMNPVVAGDCKQDRVLDELVDLKIGLTPPLRKVQDVELTPHQYARLLELHGTVASGGMTMHQRLDRLFQSDAYQRLPKEGLDPSMDRRVVAVRRVVTGYREAATRAFIRENPGIQTAIRKRAQDAAMVMRQRRSGTYDAIADLAR